MSHDHLLPPGVDPKDAELLRRAYALDSVETGQQLYTEWAETYDRTMIDGLKWLSPARLSGMFAAHLPWRDQPVLDLGTGTGLIGGHLGEAGFTTIDGFDLSATMMAKAAERGVYRDLIVGDLTRPLPFADAAYGAAICNGTFTSGHVDASCLDEIARVIAPGGIFAAAVHHAVWVDFGFEAGFARLRTTGVFTDVEIVETPYYETSSGTDGRLIVVRRS